MTNCSICKKSTLPEQGLHGISGLTFHDTRATAATRLSKKLNPLQLAKMFGWKDLKQAMVYYRETSEEIAKLL